MKKKKWSIMLCLIFLFTGAVSLTACGNENEAQADQNNYVEQKVQLPKGADIIMDVSPMDDGSWGISGFNKKETEGAVWTSADQGKTWKKTSNFTKSIDKFKSSEAQWQTALSPSGDVFAFADSEKAQKAYLVKDNGRQTQELKLKGGAFKADFAQDGSLLIQTIDGQLQKIDKKSGTVHTNFLDKDNGKQQLNDFCIQDGLLYAFFNEKVLSFSVETGEEVPADKDIQKAAENVDNSENFEPGYNQQFVVSKGKTFQTYCMDKNGIYLYEGAGSRLLIEGTETCLYGNQSSLYAFEKMDDDHLLAAAFSDGEYGLFTYVYDKGKQKEKEELTLYSLMENKDFNNAIGRYQRKHPSVKITVKTGITEDKGITRSDALKTLNADILAGNGPDLICLNDMPVENFIKNGLLEDLSEQIKTVNKEEGLFTNITGSYEKDGKICAIPTQFGLMSIEGPGEAVKASSDLTEFVKNVEALSQKAPALSGDNFNNNVMLLYRAFLTTKITDQNMLSEADLKTFYEQIHKLYQLYDEKELADQELSFEEMDLTPYSWPDVRDAFSKSRKLHINYLVQFGDFQELKALEKKEKKTYSLLGPKGNKRFAPQHVLGVSAKSEKKEAAKEFVAFMLTKEAQECYYLPGGRVSMLFPVNQKLAEEQIRLLSATETQDTESGESIPLPALNEQDKRDTMQLLKSVTTPISTDGLLKEIVIGQLESYLKGDQSLDQAVKNAMKKIQLYLAE